MKTIIYQMLPRLFSNVNEHPVFNGSIGQNGCGKLNDINARVLEAIKQLGATHVWFTGVIEHATQTDYSAQGIAPCNPHVVKGKAGSPYAISDYYDIDPDLATYVPRRMNEWQALIDRTHKAGLKVIMDFVPNHVARQYSSDAKPADVADLGEGDNTGMFFDPANNFFYITGEPFAPSFDVGNYREFPAKATGNDCFNAHPGVNDWYETVKLNYGVDPWNGSKHFIPVPSTWMKMLNILLFWAGKGVDGFRCDMAHMVPVEFWHWAIGQVKHLHPEVIFIAEIYDTALYQSYIDEGGFDYLYNKVTLYDTLCNILRHNQAAADITRCWQTVEPVADHMLNFLENHDEQRLASRFLAGDGTKARPALVVSATIDRCPFMLYMGQEVGEPAQGATGFSGDDGRTTIFDYGNVPSLQRWYNRGQCNTQRLTTDEKALRTYYQRVLNVCRNEAAIGQGKFFDLMYVNHGNLDPASHYAYLRHAGNETLVVVANFGEAAAHLSLNIPQHALDFLGIAPGLYHAQELLGGEKAEKAFSSVLPFAVDVEPFNAVIWKFKSK